MSLPFLKNTYVSAYCGGTTGELGWRQPRSEGGNVRPPWPQCAGAGAGEELGGPEGRGRAEAKHAADTHTPAGARGGLGAAGILAAPPRGSLQSRRRCSPESSLCRAWGSLPRDTLGDSLGQAACRRQGPGGLIMRGAYLPKSRVSILGAWGNFLLHVGTALKKIGLFN